MSDCPLVDQAISRSLHQLTVQEEQSFLEHLTTCTPCRLNLTEIQETLDHLAFAAPVTTPPAGLRDRVVQAVAREASSERHLDQKKRRWVTPLWAAAAAVAALAIGSYALVRTEGLRQLMAGFQQAAPVERTVTMIGTTEAPTAIGRVLVAREGGGTRLSLQAQGLPSLKPGEAYQLWLIKNGQRTSGGVFVVDATGNGGVATWLPEHVEFEAMGITREPDALGSKPRGSKVMGSTT